MGKIQLKTKTKPQIKQNKTKNLFEKSVAKQNFSQNETTFL